MAYQFAHLETFSRKSTGKKLSVSQILSEARRDEGACPHVPNPAAPDLVYGMDLTTLEALHDSKCDEATTTNAKGQTRKIRKDQQTLGTVVLSYPADGQDYNLWEDKSLEWLKEKYGDQLKTVVRHTDESHPHLHAYLLADDMKASQFNEGKKAKDAYMASSDALSLTDTKERNKLGDRAYRQAMRDWQDSYWEAVGVPCGLARLGPGKRRLSRPAWQAEQAQAGYLKKTIEKGDKWGKAYKERVLKEAREEIEFQKKAHDSEIQKLRSEIQSLKSEMTKEQEKVDRWSSKSFVQKLLIKTFNRGKREGIKESQKKVNRLNKQLSSMTEELETVKEAHSKATGLNNKLSSETFNLKQDNTKIKKELYTVTEERNRFRDIVDKSENKNSISSDSIHRLN